MITFESLNLKSDCAREDHEIHPTKFYNEVLHSRLLNWLQTSELLSKFSGAICLVSGHFPLFITYLDKEWFPLVQMIERTYYFT
jgi:hypothetical protein